MLFDQSVQHCEPFTAVSGGKITSSGMVRLIHKNSMEELTHGGRPMSEQARRMRINDFKKELNAEKGQEN